MSASPNPLPRRWLRWTLAIGFLPALIVAFYLIENYRGEKAWNEQTAKLEAAGISVNFEDYLKADVEIPDDQNVAAAEPYIRLRNTSSPVPPALGFEKTLRGFVAYYPGSFATATPPDFGGDSARRIKSAPPLSADPPTAARQVLDQFSVHEPLLVQIRSACARPRVQFDLQSANDGTLQIPQLSWVTNTTKLLRIRCTAFLTLNRGPEALADLKLILRQAEVGRAPTLIGMLLEQATCSMTIDHLWHGLATDAWTGDQLRELDSLYQNLDPSGACRLGIQSEHAMMQTILSGYAQNRRKGNKEIASLLNWTTQRPRFVPANWDEQRINLTANLIPTGWIRQNQASYAAGFHTWLQDLRIRTSQPGTFKPSRLPAPSASAPPTGIYSLLADTLASPQRLIFDKQCRLVATIALARTAIALEQHRRATGAFPATLAELSPPPPADPITGAPLHYERLPDGKRFKLWSVALDGADDGGQILERQKVNPDWLWLSWMEPPKPSAPLSPAPAKKKPIRSHAPHPEPP